jgi:flagellar motility protein MotE (MotC chaperone)
MIDTNGKLYIGRQWNLESGETEEEALIYDPDDLTTHGVVVGMTGSGKTGLCIDMLEETALQGIPALMIDPKGDITNTLLHFPELLPEDFEPWINPDEARRDGKTIEEAAGETADLWRNGLDSWGIQGDRIQALKESAAFAIYTPGSDAGLPVSILASLEAPQISWDQNRELLREQIASTVTALLGLIGLTNIDPVSSREHVLLANIFENAWSRGKDLDLGELIMQIQSPPFDKVGFLTTEAFFPEKDRFALAAKLNNLVASPSFQSWVEGEPLDIQTFLFHEDGRPRHSVFYIAHLAEQERMFFVTLFFSAVESWMRGQSGTSSLRSLIYFDEIFGYLPPTSNPPSKEPMLRLLKQARAFGVGLLLATQNPVDVDYKALSNAGTWFIGRLATARDKERLLDGLSAASGVGLDRGTLSDAISSLGKRVFVVRNVHEKESLLFQTRWAMNYLAGPMTRIQIPALNALVGAEPVSDGGAQEAIADQEGTAGVTGAVVEFTEEDESSLLGTRTRPPTPKGIDELFIPPTMTPEEAVEKTGRGLPIDVTENGLLYKPQIFAQVSVLYNARKYDVRYEKEVAFLVPDVSSRGIIDWEDYAVEPLDVKRLGEEPPDTVLFAALEASLEDKSLLKSIESNLAGWIYREMPLMIKANEALNIFADPSVDMETFHKRCEEAADSRLQAEEDKLEEKYKRKIEALENKLKREERELEENRADVQRRKQEEYTTYAETLFSFFAGRRRSLSSAMSKRGRRSKAQEDVDESIEEIAELQEDIDEIETELADEIDALEEKWIDIAEDVKDIPVAPYKKDIHIDFFGIAWLPYYIFEVNGRIFEIPAFEIGE